jgi:hypothetical protein
MGYGIKSTKTVPDRISNCNNFLEKWPGFAELLDGCFIDNMSNDFNNLTGSWPESYIFADNKGIGQWKTNFLGPDGQASKIHPHKDILDYAESRKWL